MFCLNTKVAEIESLNNFCNLSPSMVLGGSPKSLV